MPSQQVNHSRSQFQQHASYQQRYPSSALAGPQQSHSGLQASSRETNQPLWGTQHGLTPTQYGSMSGDYISDYSSSQVGRSARPQLPQHHAPAGHTSSYSSYPGRQPPVPHFQHQYRPTPSNTPSPGSKPQIHLQQSKMKFQSQHSHMPLRREPTFPPDSVECTRPIFTKRRKLTSRDLGMYALL